MNMQNIRNPINTFRQMDTLEKGFTTIGIIMIILYLVMVGVTIWFGVWGFGIGDAPLFVKPTFGILLMLDLIILMLSLYFGLQMLKN